jgi:A/G-specific adenine glycosylase
MSRPLNSLNLPAAESAEIAQISQRVIDWQRAHGRHQLPWQQDVTPYKVLVSELMLQQTQVATVIPYFERWMQAFPQVEALAAAPEDEVMRLWQGLGYYARARNLLKAARYIAALGEFPNTLDSLLQVPGVGRYTAGAIMSFAYQQYGPIVDGNVRRLYCRLFALEGVPHTPALEKQLWAKAEVLTPQHQQAHPDCRAFAQGLLDLGATVCKPRQPQCDLCPLATHCKALAQNQVAMFPNAKPKKAVPVKDGHFLLTVHQGKVLLVKRPGAGIWPALWCLPQPATAPADAVLAGEFTHQFTHYKLAAKVWQAELTVHSAEQIWVDRTNLDDYGLPAPVRVYLTAVLSSAENLAINLC